MTRKPLAPGEAPSAPSALVVLLSLIRAEIDSSLADLAAEALGPAAIDALVRDIEGDVERVRGEVDKLLQGPGRSPGGSGHGPDNNERNK